MADQRMSFARQHLQRLAHVIGDTDGILDELVATRGPTDEIERAVADVPLFRTKHWDSVLDLGLYRVVLYVLTRKRQPRVVVETGVLHGLTSAFIIAALEKNGAGRLVSVDLPSYFETGPVNQDGFLDTLPPGKNAGWVLGDEHRAMWQLELGRSLDVLPPLLAREGTIDLFLHDSEHTVATMTGEFELAWSHLEDGGALVADNIDTNSAFSEFCARVHRTPILFPEEYGDTLLERPRFGVIFK
jgi:hypothetical protein